VSTSAQPVDEVAVGQALDGHRPYLSPADRREVVRRLHALGLNDPEIASRVGIDRQTVQRIRARTGLPANVNNAGVPITLEVVNVPRPRSGDLIPHPGAAKVAAPTDRSVGGSSFIDGFLAHPFNRLKARTATPCDDYWDVFSPPEKPDEDVRDYQSAAYQKEERERVREAKALCAKCPIQAECLEFAMTPGERGGAPTEFGIWAGTTERERNILHHKRVRAAKS
jgi:hypothetical protein